ncbi:MAG: hypothetical protein KDB68_12445 [Planctomycetes bacterium]|nr:hypothetical protein [Planctomycetota bacterium]
MAQQNKVASWYWITSAVLTPFVMISCVVWAYYAQQVQSYRAQGTQLVSQLEENHAQLDPLVTHMKEIADVTGWKMGVPRGGVNDVVSKVQAPSVFQGEERTLPADKRSPLMNAYLDAESRFYGSGDGAGYVHDYVAVRDWLTQFEDKLKRYVAFKSYQYYTVKTIDIGGGESAVVAEGDLGRAVTTPADGVPVPPDAQLNDAWTKYTSNTPPSDRVMQEPTKITLEVIFRKQTQLVRDLVSANLHQYNLLFADVSGLVTVQNEDGTTEAKWVGFEGEEKSLAGVLEKLSGLSRRVSDRKAESISQLDDAFNVADLAKAETDAKKVRLELMVVGAEGRISDLQTSFQNEKATHESDAQEFENLIRNLPRLKIPVKLEKSDPDGEITYSDYTRGVTHIDLGYSDGVRIGQRFEVWRRHGFEKDEFVGVIEVIRMLSAHYSLCTVLTLTDENDPVSKGDQIMSKIWHDGKFLSIALHGSYEPPNEAYSKERLTEMLKQLGVTVVEKVQPGTDIVILGSNLLGDEWYRRARNDLRFETLKEDDIRIYVDPR